MRGLGNSRWVRAVAAASLSVIWLSSAQPGRAQASPSGPVCDDSWTNPAGGDWSSGSDSTNWSTHAEPTSTQAVCINIPLSAPVVTNVGVTIGSLTLGGSSGTSELRMINGITLSSNSSIGSNGLVTATAGGFNTGSATLTNDGVINATGGLRDYGNFTNEADGLVEVPGEIAQYTGTFTNLGNVFVQPGGTFQIPGGTPATINNAGGLIENQGVMYVYSGGTFDQGAGQVVGGPVNLQYPDGGALDLTGSGAGTFFLQSGATLTGNVAAGQTVILAGASATGSFTNAGTLIGENGTSLALPQGDTLTNSGTIEVPPGDGTNIIGNVVNQASGVIALNNSGFGLTIPNPPPATPYPTTLTNDGTITVPPNSTLQTGPNGIIDNDAGTIANAGTVNVSNGGSFIEGSGTVTGNPVNVSGALDMTGTGASSFNFTSTTATISGNIAAGQTIRENGSLTALGGFTNAGTWIGNGGGPLSLPAGATMINTGTIEFGHGGGGSGGWVLDGNLTNASTGVMGENGGGFSMGEAGTTFENDGTIYLIFGTEMDFRGQGTCGGSGQPACDINWYNNGTVYWGMGSGNSWGGFGLASSFGASSGDVISLGGTIVPVPIGEPPATSTTPPNPQISYGISGTPVWPPGLGPPSPPTYTLTCPAAIADGWTINCGNYTTLYEYYSGSSGPIPTQIQVSGSGTPNGYNTLTSYGPPVTITAVLSAQDGSTPTGSVDFYGPAQNTGTFGPDLLGTAPLVTSGGLTTATLTTSLAPGTYDLMALYPGDAHHLATSTSYGNDGYPQTQNLVPTGTEAVNPQTTSVGLTSTSSSSTFGSPITFTATVTPGALGTLNPTGFVTFINASSGQPYASVPVTTSGGATTAQWTTTNLPVGAPDHLGATFSGDINYSGSSTTTALSETVTTLNPIRPQVISFTAPVSGTVGGSDPLTPTATSGLPVTLTVDPSTSPAGACTFSGGSVSYVHAGTCVLDANQMGNSTFSAALQVTQSISINPGSQTVQFTSSEPTSGTVNGATYTPTASASSGLTPVITLDPLSTGCALDSGTGVVSFTTSGTCIIDANQAGNSDYLAATPVQDTFPVYPAAQTITFVASTTGTVNGSSLLGPTASSQLTVSLTVDGTTSPVGACTLTGDTVQYVHAGSCVLDANQSGNVQYAPAPQVTQTIVIGAATQTVQFTSTAPSSVTAGGPTYSPAASATSGLAPVLTLDNSSTGCSINAGTVSFTSAGTCVIDANQSGNSDYQAAAQVQQKITVTAAGGAVTPATVEALTLSDVQGSAPYKALTPARKAAVNATIGAAASILSLITPSTPPAVKAAIINLYKLEVNILKAAGWLTAGQAATLVADANSL